MSFRPELNICLPPEHSVCSVRSAPHRWDEYLDLDIPILIYHTCGDWSDVCSGLNLSGLAHHHDACLVTSHGRVTNLEAQQSAPQEPWCIVLGWNRPEQECRSKSPLSGQTFVVTREESQGRALVSKLEQLGAQAVAIPTICFEPADDLSIIRNAFEHLTTFQWLIFTSVNGVECFFNLLQQSEYDHRSLGSCQFACIGPKTAGALEARGFSCDLAPDIHVAEGLLNAFKETLGTTLNGLKVLIPRAQAARETVPTKLREWGAEVVVAPVYQTRMPKFGSEKMNALPSEAKVLFTSASTVKNWIEMTNQTDFSCYCIGPVTAQAAKESGLNVLGVAEPHTVDGLIQILILSASANTQST